MLDLSKIRWPIYQLSNEATIENRDGDKIIELADGSYRLLDSSRFEGSFAMRRLMYEAEQDPFKYKLFKLKNPIFRFEVLLHEAEGESRYIDSSGYIFRYKKNTYYPLRYFKIIKFVETRHGYAVEVKGIHCRFFVTREPQLEWHYAGIICTGRGFILYDFSKEKKPDTRRMI